MAASFWLGFALPWLLATLALGGITSCMQVTGAWLRGGSIALLVGWPLSVTLLAWGAVGAWRAASKRASMANIPGRAWARVVQAAVAAGVLAIAVGLVFNFAVHARSHAALASGMDPLGQVTATASPDGRRLRLVGPLGLDDAALVRARLRELPELRLLELDMAGGRMAEAQRVAEAVAALGLQTRVVGACDNACVPVFLAGKSRQLLPEGRLGLHRLAPASMNPLFVALARHQQAALFRGAGLPEAFIAKGMATPPGRLWQPDTDELLTAGLVGVAGRPLDIALPGPAGTPVADYVEALRTHWIWRALDARHGGAMKVAAERMAAARDAGADDDATQVSGQRVIEVLLPGLLANAGPGLWEPFAALLADQLAAAAATTPEACAAVLAGDAMARRSLPAPLQQREAEWLAAALAEPADRGAPRKPTALEREVMSRALGERAVGQLTGFLGPAQRQRPCAQATALLSAVSALPPAERQLARRFMFAPR